MKRAEIAPELYPQRKKVKESRARQRQAARFGGGKPLAEERCKRFDDGKPQVVAGFES
jgi:hypothetical protein